MPSRSVSRWLNSFGIAVSAGTLLDRNADIVGLLKPMVEAIKAHMATANVLHGDETSWRLQARGENGDGQRALCWAHVRRDFLQAAAGAKAKLPWSIKWLDAIGELYRCNKQRVELWNKNLPLAHQGELFNRAQRELECCGLWNA